MQGHSTSFDTQRKWVIDTGEEQLVSKRQAVEIYFLQCVNGCIIEAGLYNEVSAKLKRYHWVHDSTE